jgi:hypothetical protein
MKQKASLACRQNQGGRKAILDEANDDVKIKEVVQANRQRLSVAKAELEEALAKQFSQKTLERHLKKVIAAE